MSPKHGRKTDRYNLLAKHVGRLKSDFKKASAILARFKDMEIKDMDEQELLVAGLDAGIWEHDLSMRAGFVKYGYQINFYDGAGQELGFVCRDFGDDYDVKAIRTAAIAAIADAFEALEEDYLEAKAK